jgi:uncharacterized protein YdeI (YjbR/CyaY-like superfamily)
MDQYDTRIDAYIAKSADFAKPILEHVRKLVHEASPLIKENIKWGMPFFEYKGPVCHMAAFKEHCAFGFWKASLLNDPQGLLKTGEAAAGSFGRVNTITDLPGDDVIKHFVLQVIEKNEQGIKVETKKAPAEKKELVVPADFTVLLNETPTAKQKFEQSSYSFKKEYLAWIAEAKTDVTRQKRIQTAVEWIAEGKSRNWKYER